MCGALQNHARVVQSENLWGHIYTHVAFREVLLPPARRSVRYWRQTRLGSRTFRESLSAVPISGDFCLEGDERWSPSSGVVTIAAIGDGHAHGSLGLVLGARRGKARAPRTSNPSRRGA